MTLNYIKHTMKKSLLLLRDQNFEEQNLQVYDCRTKMELGTHNEYGVEHKSEDPKFQVGSNRHCTLEIRYLVISMVKK